MWLLPCSDGSQMVTETCKPAQRRCPKSVLPALTCDYLTALVILAALPAIKELYCRRPPCLPRPPRMHSLAETEVPFRRPPIH